MVIIAVTVAIAVVVEVAIAVAVVLAVVVARAVGAESVLEISVAWSIVASMEVEAVSSKADQWLPKGRQTQVKSKFKEEITWLQSKGVCKISVKVQHKSKITNKRK